MTKTEYIIMRSVDETLDEIEKELIEYLNWHKAEKRRVENDLYNDKNNYDHLKYFNAYEDGAISVLKDSINAIRKRYNRVI